jgi:hypothetical protein
MLGMSLVVALVAMHWLLVNRDYPSEEERSDAQFFLVFITLTTLITYGLLVVQSIIR